MEEKMHYVHAWKTVIPRFRNLNSTFDHAGVWMTTLQKFAPCNLGGHRKKRRVKLAITDSKLTARAWMHLRSGSCWWFGKQRGYLRDSSAQH